MAKIIIKDGELYGLSSNLLTWENRRELKLYCLVNEVPQHEILNEALGVFLAARRRMTKKKVADLAKF